MVFTRTNNMKWFILACVLLSASCSFSLFEFQKDSLKGIVNKPISTPEEIAPLVEVPVAKKATSQPTSQPVEQAKDDSLLKSKTFWTGVAEVIGGIAYGYTTKDYASAIIIILTGFAFIFQRKATQKQHTIVKEILNKINKS